MICNVRTTNQKGLVIANMESDASHFVPIHSTARKFSP